jgi:hypothetical protein
LFPKFSDVVSFLAILRQDAAQQQKVQPALVENWNFDLSARRLINKFSDGSIEGQQSKVDYFGRLFLAEYTFRLFPEAFRAREFF